MIIFCFQSLLQYQQHKRLWFTKCSIFIEASPSLPITILHVFVCLYVCLCIRVCGGGGEAVKGRLMEQVALCLPFFLNRKYFSLSLYRSQPLTADCGTIGKKGIASDMCSIELYWICQKFSVFIWGFACRIKNTPPHPSCKCWLLFSAMAVSPQSKEMLSEETSAKSLYRPVVDEKRSLKRSDV